MTVEGVQARVETLRAEVTAHKRAMRRHREALGAAKSALVQLEAECRRRGIGLFVTQAAAGEGAIHGRSDDTSDPGA